MKTLYTCLIAVFIVATAQLASAQTKTVAYFSKGEIRLLSSEGAYYVEHTEVNNTGGGTRERFLQADGRKVFRYSYSSFEGGEDDNGILEGAYSTWHSNGKLSESGNFENNKLHGKVSTWFESGKLSYEKNYVNGELQDTLTGYDEKGRVRRVEVYNRGEMVEGTVFSEKGAVVPYFPAFVLPSFPGEEAAMMAYISKNLKYPEEAIQTGLSGLVMISFIVEKDGSINALEVIKSMSDALDSEAARVVRAMPRWKPGLLEGKPVPVRFTLPVRFSIVD